MTENFIEKIGRLRSVLAENGFSEIDYNYSDLHFGNEYVVYDNGGLKIRILKDRGYYVVDIQISRDREWHSAERVLKVLSMECQGEFVDAKTDCEDQWTSVCENISLNIHLLSTSMCERLLSKIE